MPTATAPWARLPPWWRAVAWTLQLQAARAVAAKEGVTANVLGPLDRAADRDVREPPVFAGL